LEILRGGKERHGPGWAPCESGLVPGGARKGDGEPRASGSVSGCWAPRCGAGLRSGDSPGSARGSPAGCCGKSDPVAMCKSSEVWSITRLAGDTGEGESSTVTGRQAGGEGSTAGALRGHGKASGGITKHSGGITSCTPPGPWRCHTSPAWPRALPSTPEGEAVGKYFPSQLLPLPHKNNNN